MDLLLSDWFHFNDLLTMAATIDADDPDPSRDCARYLNELDKQCLRREEEYVHFLLSIPINRHCESFVLTCCCLCDYCLYVSDADRRELENDDSLEAMLWRTVLNRRYVTPASLEKVILHFCNVRLSTPFVTVNDRIDSGIV